MLSFSHIICVKYEIKKENLVTDHNLHIKNRKV